MIRLCFLGLRSCKEFHWAELCKYPVPLPFKVVGFQNVCMRDPFRTCHWTSELLRCQLASWLVVALQQRPIQCLLLWWHHRISQNPPANQDQKGTEAKLKSSTRTGFSLLMSTSGLQSDPWVWNYVLAKTKQTTSTLSVVKLFSPCLKCAHGTLFFVSSHHSLKQAILPFQHFAFPFLLDAEGSTNKSESEVHCIRLPLITMTLVSNNYCSYMRMRNA